VAGLIIRGAEGQIKAGGLLGYKCSYIPCPYQPLTGRDPGTGFIAEKTPERRPCGPYPPRHSHSRFYPCASERHFTV